MDSKLVGRRSCTEW